jgi:hypothetical protein
MVRQLLRANTTGFRAPGRGGFAANGPPRNGGPGWFASSYAQTRRGFEHRGGEVSQQTGPLEMGVPIEVFVVVCWLCGSIYSRVLINIHTHFLKALMQTDRHILQDAHTRTSCRINTPGGRSNVCSPYTVDRNADGSMFLRPGLIARCVGLLLVSRCSALR